MLPADQKSNLRILLVDDNEKDSALFRQAFEKALIPHRIVNVNCTEEGWRVINSEASSFDVIVCEDKLSGKIGMDLYREMVTSNIDKPFVLLKKYGEVRWAVVPLKNGLVDFIAKDSNLNFWNSLPAALTTLVQEYNDLITLNKGEGALFQEIQTFRTAMNTGKYPGSEAQYNSLIELTNDAVFLTVDNRFESVNRGFMELFGVSKEEICSPGYNLIDLTAPRSQLFYEENLKKINAGETGLHRFEFTALSREGQEIEVEASMISFKINGRIAVQGIIRDISERKMLEAQLLQAQKMEAIGQLAGGVAHDFNNLLTVIIGNCELILRESYLSNHCTNYLEGIHRAASAASNLTKQLLAFSRKQTHECRIVDLNEVILDMDKMLRRIIGENIDLKTIQAEEPCNVRIDPAQFGQVIVNLAVNARDAMPDGGSLIIELKKCCLDDENIVEREGVPKGTYILLEVSDTGVGLVEEVKKKIFDPFFTTKEKGKGTGLGLSMVYGIVKQSEGYIWVDSVLDQGTIFKIYLPLVEGESEEVDNIILLEDLPGGTESILLVEDDEDVRELAENTLKLKGYKVITAKDGVEAFEVTKRMKNSLNILLTDVAMPKMNGIELADLVKGKWEDLKILFMSGYTNKDIIRHGIFTQDIHFIQKPFHTATLLQKVRAVLDS
ncbi:MAG: response regulator [candidate division Zixibacteria bacterium]|nr:response regulator [Candidatus Tariuqbacter arcticus]